ncbi:DEAD/DEAH box helicase [Microbacterium timonense]|uniref:DEAD/DEAH box helicase n=1 Tax=Microbacterium timonense TaxID=2086576 RepID=UPI000D112EF0|nr:DEAD/DEAH box helicase [Microbacterium timonense]
MPKNKKPGGGRAPKNFDPRYNPRYRASGSSRDTEDGDRKRRPGESSAGKAGSRSPGHRGHRPSPTASDADVSAGRGGARSAAPRGAVDAGGPKRRWTEQERAGRDEARAIRTHTRDIRPRSRPDDVPDRLAAEPVATSVAADTTFATLGLGQNIVKTLGELGARHPFPIQAATIPAIIEGRDVLARGRTGSGKTIAFGAPLVESVLRSQAGQKRQIGRPPRALILAPTRELALQIDATIQPLARSVGLFTTQIYGGVPHARQLGALKKGVDIVIGTPGRIEDLTESRALDLSHVRVVVLDEADHMCELGFLEPVQRIMRRTPRDAQRLLFSATLDAQVTALVREFLSEPVVFEVAGETQRSGTIDHRVLVVDHRDKREILRTLAGGGAKALVFTRTRAYAEMLAEQFDEAGIRALALHGDLDQARRSRNLERLTSGRIDVLVATDVAARGIHVDDIDLVIQADPPDEFKAYLHRAGRTGRAGRPGTVVTLVTRARRERLAELLERADIEAPFVEARPGDAVLDELARQ